MSETLFFKTAVLLSAVIFILPTRLKVAFSVLLHLVVAIVTTTWLLDAWQSPGAIVIDLGIPFWGGTPSFVIDKLSAFFILIINILT